MTEYIKSGEIVTHSELQDRLNISFPIDKPPKGWSLYIKPEPTEAEKNDLARQAFKIERAIAVSKIKVTSSLGRTFDGDEQSTTRMLKPIKVLESEPDGSTTLWVLADNTPAQVGLAEFLEVLKLAGLEQTRLWLPPS